MQNSLRAMKDQHAGEFIKELSAFLFIQIVSQSVSNFKSIFELLWNERLLNEELKSPEAMQKELSIWQLLADS